MLSGISPSPSASPPWEKQPSSSQTASLRPSAPKADARADHGAPSSDKDPLSSRKGNDPRISLADSTAEAKGKASPSSAGHGLTRAEQMELRELKQRDQEVKAHERAHIAAGGSHVQGGARFSYRLGPDGNRYAVGGEVSIDTASVPQDPEATLRKAEAIRKAALAPAQPSAQDRAVAAEAARMAAEAQQDILEAELEAQKASEPVSPPKAAGLSFSGDSEAILELKGQAESMQQARTMNASAAAMYRSHTLSNAHAFAQPPRIDELI